MATALLNANKTDDGFIFSKNHFIKTISANMC